MESRPLISIIIPAYNAEHSLLIALESLQKQDYSNLEIIIVNDCSTDNTLNVIYRFISILKVKSMTVKIIVHEHNRGVAAARNTGLNHATGEYIYYVDADDHIEPDAISLLVRAAVSENADIVGCNWFLTFKNNERRMNQPFFADPKDAIQKMLNGSMRWNLWLFMVRRSIYINYKICFIPGMNMGEDLMVMVKLFIHASQVSYLNEALYHYGQTNDQSLTKIYSDAHVQEVTANVKELEQYILDSSFAGQLGNSIDFLKLNVKLPLLISDSKEHYQRWLLWYPEANDKVMENHALPFRTRIIQWLAGKSQFWALRLYHWVVIKFVYGKLYN